MYRQRGVIDLMFILSMVIFSIITAELVHTQHKEPYQEAIKDHVENDHKSDHSHFWIKGANK